MRQHYIPVGNRRGRFSQVAFSVAAISVLVALMAWGLEVDAIAQEDDAALQAALRPADHLPSAERRAYADGVRAAFVAARNTRDGQALAVACKAAGAQ